MSWTVLKCLYINQSGTSMDRLLWYSVHGCLNSRSAKCLAEHEWTYRPRAAVDCAVLMRVSRHGNCCCLLIERTRENNSALLLNADILYCTKLQLKTCIKPKVNRLDKHTAHLPHKSRWPTASEDNMTQLRRATVIDSPFKIIVLCDCNVSSKQQNTGWI